RQRFVRRIDVVEAEGAAGVLHRDRPAGFVVAVLLPLRAAAALRLRIRSEVPAAPRHAAGRRAAAVEGARAAERSRRTRGEAAAGAARAGPGGVAARPRRTARPAIFAGARLADREGASIEGLPVEALDRLLGVRAVDEFDECEPAGAAGLAIDRQHDLRRRRHRAEVGAQISFGGAVGKITDEQADGQSTLSYVVEDEAG